MKLQKVVIENFRGYKEKTEIEFSNLTAFVGKNDIGKSTVMEALDVFFHDGKGIVKLDKGDINVENNRAGNLDIIITGIFTDLPEKVIIDESYETTLENEYLVNKDNKFEIIKKFKNGSTLATSLKTEIKAFHPSNPKCNNLLQKKNADLKKIVDELNLECDKTINSSMRRAIWEYYKDSLELKELTIDVSSKEGDIKAIWTKLQTYLPSFSLFQSDRKNNDTDDEVQDPLKEAVKAIFLTPDIQGTLQKVAIQVKEKIQEVTDLTLEKIKDVSPEIASSLHPNIPDVESLKWYDVFKNLSISGDEDIPINKRGSGIRRLILLSFFRAEAEKRQKVSNNPSIIYAIEEPETSQHKAHQQILIEALKSLARSENSQVIITTHSSEIVKNLDFNNLLLITKDENNNPKINRFEPNCLPYPSLNEANYNAFADISEEFHNELYGYLQSKAIEENTNNERENPFDDWLVLKGCTKSKDWIRIKDGVPKPAEKKTLQTFIRNLIHHPENKNNSKYTKEELKKSIEKMISIIKTLH